MPRSSVPRTRVVLITGVSSGIGEALARRFSLAGDTVIGFGRDRKRLARLKRTLRSPAGRFLPLVCDVRRDLSVNRAMAQVVRRHPHVDILINNAGVTVFKDLLKTRISEYDQIMETNVRGMFLVTRSVLPLMIRRKSGLIVNILSFAAKTVYRGSSIYTASKNAGEALMNVLREEVREKNVKILNVYPGAVETPMWSRLHRKRLGKLMMHPSDVAGVVYEISLQSSVPMVEEIVVRPQHGDLTI